MKHLAIDYGLKNVGIAVSDEEGKMAFPKTVFVNDKNLIGKIVKMIKDENVKHVIIGKSLNLSGDPNPIMEKIFDFKKRLKDEVDLPMHFQREWYTSAEADRVQGQSLRNIRKGDRKAKGVNLDKNDASAAALILRSYLERR